MTDPGAGYSVRLTPPRCGCATILPRLTMLYRTAIWTGWNNARSVPSLQVKFKQKCTCFAKRRIFYLQGGGVLDATCKLFLFCRLFFLGGASGAGVSAGAASRMACFSAMVWFSLSTRAWAASRAASRSIFAVGVQRSGPVPVRSGPRPDLRLPDPQPPARQCAPVRRAARLRRPLRRPSGHRLQQGGLTGSACHRRQSGSGFAIVAAPDGDKALPGADGQRRAVSSRQAERAGGASSLVQWICSHAPPCR